MTADPVTPPLYRALRPYGLADLRADLPAGVAVAAVGLPSAVAYPAIAGLPPETGLYASIAPLAAYALLGPSRRLVVGPDAATMTIVAAVLATAAAQAPPGQPFPAAAAASALALGVGLWCLVARGLGLGVVGAFLSRPILLGFFAGVSLSILIGQLDRLTGVPVEAEGLIRPLAEFVGRLDRVHWPTLALAAGAFVLLQTLDALRSPLPGAVVVLALAGALSWALDLGAQGVATVGDLPASLPSLAFPDLGALPPEALALGSGAIFLVSFGAGLVTARSFGARTGERVDPDRELVGFGAANLAAGFFGAFPVTASDSRTAVNHAVGGRTPVAALVAAGAMAFAIVWLGGALRVLPVPALAAVLVSAALSLIDWPALRQLWRISRAEFLFSVIALLGPVSLGVLNGVVIAVVAAMLDLLRRAMQPRDALLGRITGRDGFYKLHRKAEARPVPGLALWMIQDALMFFNADFVRDRLDALLDRLPADTRWLVIDASATPRIDSTGAAMLDEAAQALARRGVRLGFAELHAEAQGLLDRAGVLDRVGRDMVFDDLDDAFRAFLARGAAPAAAGA